MATSRFADDLNVAKNAGILGVANIRRGESDGEMVFRFSHPQLSHSISIQALAVPAGRYPPQEGFFVFAECDVQSKISTALAKLQKRTANKDVTEVLRLASRRLTRILDDGNADDDGDDADDDDDEDDDYDYDYEDDDYEDYNQDDDDLELYTSDSSPTGATDAPAHAQHRLYSDLQAAHDAGLHVGLHVTSAGRVYSVALRVRKLGIPDEALEAWGVRPGEYIVLIFKPNGFYRGLECLLSSGTNLQYRIGRCSKSKPSSESVDAAFKVDISAPSFGHSDEKGVFVSLYMSTSIDRILNQDFIQLVKMRIWRGFSWDEARTALSDDIAKGHVRSAVDGEPDQTQQGPEMAPRAAAATGGGQGYLISPSAPASLNKDHVLASNRPERMSTPLLAMQLALRHFAQCTSYCMICSKPMRDKFEAVKPFVCDSPLCLHQYIDVGLGPAVEHEIVCQPLVVDLLISFFYSAACLGQNRSWPRDLSIKVPRAGSGLLATMYIRQNELAFVDPNQTSNVRARDWILVAIQSPSAGRAVEYICRVQRVLHDRIAYEPVVAHGGWLPNRAAPRPFFAQALLPPSLQPAVLSFEHTHVYWAKDGTVKVPELEPCSQANAHVYPFDMDANNSEHQLYNASSMCRLMNAIPPVDKTRDWLLDNPGRNLRSWDCMPPGSLTLLRWIIKSNRSAIVQLDRPPGGHGSGTSEYGSGGIASDKSHHKVLGLGPQVLQFRFAQGTAEKEMRFSQGLMAQKLIPTAGTHVPTLFAWHGSALKNWHSIIRTGLDFSDTANGRAYGNGVYMSHSYLTSSGYSPQVTEDGWPNSVLGVRGAMAICEVVNSPREFVSSIPHIVVNKVDWIQVRYLTVSVRSPDTSDGLDIEPGKNEAVHSQTSLECLVQDDRFRLRGPMTCIGEGEVSIPISVIPAWRRSYYRSVAKNANGEDVAAVGKSNSKKPKQADTGVKTKDDGGESDSDSDDLNMLRPGDQVLGKRPRISSVVDSADPKTCVSNKRPTKGAALTGGASRQFQEPATPLIDVSMTTFRPGRLDSSTLPLMPSPNWAQPGAQKHMLGEIKRLQSIQTTTPLHELGWYVDFDVGNLFQWIVELHSFDKSLPLAQDMKRMACTSIVTEVRFPASFPMSPPFVRIIRPRFLRFLDGGGGHVTAGGSICMELLTSSGWTPAVSLDSVLMQVRLALTNREPRPGRLLANGHLVGVDYGIDEAVGAYKRVAMDHGWKVPADLSQTGADWK